MLADPEVQVALLSERIEHLTELDIAALVDIGWQIGTQPLSLEGDYNNDQIINAADYTIWQDTLAIDVSRR